MLGCVALVFAALASLARSLIAASCFACCFARLELLVSAFQFSFLGQRLHLTSQIPVVVTVLLNLKNELIRY